MSSVKEKIDRIHLKNTPTPSGRGRIAAFEKLYQQLNKEQREAVDAIEGPVMVLAGPGTGKTQVLAMRVANILRQTQIDPWNILCLTFTDSAATNMRQRLLQIIGEAAYYVRIQTFHAFCNDVIQDNPDIFAQGEGTVLSDVERIELWQQLLDGLPGHSVLKPFGQPYFYLSDILSAIQALKKEGITPSQFKKLVSDENKLCRLLKNELSGFLALKPMERTAEICHRLISRLVAWPSAGQVSTAVFAPLDRIIKTYRELEDGGSKKAASKLRTQFKNNLKKHLLQLAKQLPRQRELTRLYEEYQVNLRKLGRYDYDDMIMQVVGNFQQDDELLAKYQEQWQYILVDEYQDTNGAQNETVFLLGSWDTQPNIFVVGDDKQSIFRFQGASLNNLLSFFTKYQDHLRIIFLEKNYRSQPAIIDAATQVIGHNRALLQKYLPAAPQSYQSAVKLPFVPLAWREFDTADEENYFVSRQIQELLKKGVDPTEIAILYRFNRDADDLFATLLRSQIPIRLEAGENVLDDPRVRQLIRLLAYLSSSRLDVKRQQDDANLARLMQYDWLRLNELAVWKIIYHASRQKLYLFEIISSPIRLKQAEVDDPDQFLRFAQQLAHWRTVAQNRTLYQLFDTVLQESGLLTAVIASDSSLQTLNNITTLFKELAHLNRTDKKLTVRRFVNRLNMMASNGLPLIAQPLQTKAHAVRLMTAHKAKGLEFTYVFLINLRDRHWGNLRERGRLKLPGGVIKYDPVAGAQNNEDERRLFYVALTRAKQQLYLSYARLDEGGRERMPTLFIREIPPPLLQSIDTAATEDEALSRAHHFRATHATIRLNGGRREWLRERVSHHVLSATHLNNYLACPKMFYYRNVLHLPSAKTKHMSFGTAVHAALKDFFTALDERQKTPGLNYLTERFAWHLAQEILTPSEIKDSEAVGQKLLSAYWRNYRASFHPGNIMEYDFRRHGIHLGAIPLTGQLDKIEIIGQNQVRVVDYKTGNPDSAYQFTKPGGKYHRQLVFYQLLCDRAPRFRYKMASGVIDFIQPSPRRGKFIRKEYVISRDEIDELEATIQRVWQEIQDLKFMEDGIGCQECEYCLVSP